MKMELDIDYAVRGAPDTFLDIYHPAEATKRTAILLLHGGGWRHGSRKNLAPHAEMLAARGFVAIPTDYGLLPHAPWPAQIRDVRRAIHWVNQWSEELQIDHVAAVGYSAGAQLALLAAGDPEGAAYDDLGRQTLEAVIAIEPPVEFYDGKDATALTPASALMGESASAELARAASPMTYVGPSYPPAVFIHGMEDRQVMPEASVRMQKALTEASVISDLHLFSGYAHAIWRVGSLQEIFMAIAANFIDRTVSSPDLYREELITIRAQMAAQFARQTGKS